MRETVVVFNPTAGRRRRRRLQKVLAVLDERHVRYRVKETSTAGDARRIAADLPQNTAMVVAVGGDGTVNEVVNGLFGAADDVRESRRPELALVPMGTANVLAAEIGLTDLSPQNIAGTIIDGQRRDIFLASASGRYLLQMCGVGFDAHVVANVNLSLKRRVGKLAYALASLAQFWRYIPRKYRVAIDGATYEAASVIVANGHFYAGRFSCAPQARIDEPMLHACLFERAGRWHVIRYAWGLLSGRLGHFRDVMVVPAEQVVIESAASQNEAEPVQGDGDIIADLPVTITAGAARLTIRCPA
jgi:YegS/Rv2252/BmrU family lipid kinase